MSTTIKTGDINHRLGAGIIVTADLIIKLGFKPDETNKRAVMWNETKYPAICDALGEHFKSKRSATGFAPAKNATPAEDPDAL